MLRISMTRLAAALAIICIAPLAHAVGNQVDVQVVDRSTGETLTPIYHHGEWWIAGRPGARYAVTITNRNGGRTLNVISVDGVNALSGETAAWSQSGYVLDGYESTEITGWRKSLDQVASFEFTALPDSYAARTGRPGNVGVIGIAMFNERPQPIAMRRDREAFGDTRRESSPVPMPAPSTLAQAPAADAAPRPAEKSTESSADAASSEARRANGFLAKRESLGTGHGAIENSTVRYTRFDRLQSTPNEVVTIHYDRRANLIAMGILPQRPLPPLAANPAANPFPNSGAFVPDPPSRR